MKRLLAAAVAVLIFMAPLSAYWDSEWDTQAGPDRYSKEELEKGFAGETSVFKIMVLGLIRLYQLNLSGKTGTDCNFYPSCSRYGFTAIKKFGGIKGGIMAVDRVLRCHNYSSTAGYDIDYGRGLLLDPVEDNDTLDFIFDWLDF